MRVFPPLVQAANLALRSIFDDGRPADRAVESVLKTHRKLGSRDRRFVAEVVYECVRWSRRWAEVARRAGLDANGDAGEGARTGAGTGPGADVGATDVRSARSGAALGSKSGDGRSGDGLRAELIVYGALQGWENFAGLNDADVERIRTANQEVDSAPRAIRESIPDDVDQIGARELAAAWDGELSALNIPAPVDLRVNRHRATRDEVRSRLAKEGVATEIVDGCPDALTLPERKNVFITAAFKEGLFEVQDRSSQRVAPFMKLEGATRVVDACAGAGGKTLHIASLMNSRGRIISMDITDWKLRELEERARRGRFSNIETRLIESTKVIKRLEESADRVLLDVPCSGLGVLRRNPGSKLRLNAGEIERLHGLQAEILESYSRMVKPGGYLVYATCSILPSENRGQVDRFLSTPAGAQFRLEEDWSALPSHQNGDGFYAARILRTP